MLPPACLRPRSCERKPAQQNKVMQTEVSRACTAASSIHAQRPQHRTAPHGGLYHHHDVQALRACGKRFLRQRSDSTHITWASAHRLGQQVPE